MRTLLTPVIAAFVFSAVGAQKKPTIVPSIQRVDPTNWWVGMKNPDLQLLVYGKDAGTLTYSINYSGVALGKTSKVENPNYAFLDISIASSARPGKFQIVGKYGKKSVTWTYELKARTSEPKGTGVTSADLIYLIMPDRFANGDSTNDKFATMLDREADRKNPFLRHGGDFKGIIEHLDYLQQLGVTALWLTPVLDNDEVQKKEGHGRMQSGYHGYHFTDHYKIDRRFGGNDGYVAFAKAVHQRGMKLVQDAVYNHISDDHWFFKDIPSKDWVNQWDTYTGSTHKEQSLFDPHAAKIDQDLMLNGWFTSFLPDLNQRNPFLANYLIQNAIWSTEIFSLDAWRIDTYKYNDEAFMNRCNDALVAEYPNIHLFGETVTGNPLALSYFVKNKVDFPIKSTLPGSLDFPVNYAINDALNQNFGWDSGVSRLYQILAQDVVYADPMKMVTSLDNHDMDRFLSVVGEDYAKYKMGVIFLLTTRGIPSWYYGTEILMKNFKNPTDAEVRNDFPGGFAGDTENKFTEKGRSPKENEAFQFVSTLATYRKATPALSSGKLMQYVPVNGVYVYFRYNNTKTIMIAANSTDHEVILDTKRFSERANGFTKYKDVLNTNKSGDVGGNLTTITLAAKTAYVLELIP